MTERKLYEKADIKKLPQSEADIVVTVPASTLESYKEKALSHIKDKASIPGFRKGKVPEKMVRERVGEMGILEEAAEHAVRDIFPEVIIDNNLDVLGRPEIQITKLAPGNPLEFKMHVVLFPSFDIPDYKPIARDVLKKEEVVSVSDQDVDAVIEEIRKLNATKNEAGEETLPEMTDEFAKKVGPFETVANLREKIKENVTKEKEFRVKEKRRLSIIGNIIEKADIPVPNILIESELTRMFAQFADDVKRMGTTVSEYLTKIKKSEEDLRKDWRKDAETRVKFELVLEKIANLENIRAPREAVEKETDHIVEHYKDAVPERVRAYVEHQMRNEEIFKFLESQK